MGEKDLKIYVVADEHKRAITLRTQVKSALNSIFQAKTHAIRTTDLHTINGLNTLFIVDLTAVDKPAKSIIKSIKDSLPQPKVIALHMYKSSILVKPLYELGIDGYLYYKNTGNELTLAIEKVTQGGHYMPAYIQAG